MKLISVLLLFSILLCYSCQTFFTSEENCVDGILFSLIHSREGEEGVDQVDADELCQSSGLGVLAPIVNESQYERVKNLSSLMRQQENTFSSRGFWIGLKDDLGNGEGDDPLRFNFTDGSQESKSFFESEGEIPWSNNQPASLAQRCVIMSSITIGDPIFNVQDGWEDRECDTPNVDTLCVLSCTSGNDEDEGKVEEDEKEDQEEDETISPINNETGNEIDSPKIFEIFMIFVAIASFLFFILLSIYVFYWRKLRKLENDMKVTTLLNYEEL